MARFVFMRGEVYTALPSDISVTDASSELRYVNANDELGLDSSQPLPKSPTMALEKVILVLKISITWKETFSKYLADMYQ